VVTTNRPRIKEVKDLSEIPSFKSEREEAEFWSTHGLSEALLAKMQPLDDVLPPARPRTRPIAVRFDDDVIGRLKVLAARKHKGYQTLLKEFVIERLYEEEKRAGLIG
jgi:hypothetical protein